MRFSKEWTRDNVAFPALYLLGVAWLLGGMFWAWDEDCTLARHGVPFVVGLVVWMIGWTVLSLVTQPLANPRVEKPPKDPFRMIFEGDREMRAHLIALGPGALAQLRRILEGSAAFRREVLRILVARPAFADLAAVLVAADADQLARSRLLSEIKNLEDYLLRFR